MAHRFSGKLSPKTRKVILTAKSDEQISCLVRIGSSPDLVNIRRKIEDLGGSIRSFMEEAQLMGVDIEAAHLQDLADIDDIVYIETGQSFSL